MARDVLITPASGIIEFKNNSVVSATITGTTGGDLELTATGDILIGDASSDLYIGDGVNNVDIIFEQSGEIRGLTGVTLTLGQADSSVQMGTTLNLNSNSISNISGLTVTGGTVDFNSGATVNFNKATGTAPFTVDSTTVVANLNADLLDGQSGAYYLNWTNVTNKPDPTLTITGDASGSATFTDLGNASLTLTISDDSHNHIIGNVDGLQTALDGKLALSGGTLSGDLQIGNGTAQTRLLIQKADNNVSDHIIFYNGTTRVGEIGVHDTWLRLNNETATNIYTPRYIRADSGFFVDNTSTGIDGSGNLIGIGTASFNGVVTSTVAAGTAPFIVASDTKVANLNAEKLDGYDSSDFFRENLGTINSSSQDFNSYTTTGSYYVVNWSESGDVVANGPTGSYAWGCLKVTQFNGATYVLQEYWPHNNDISWSRVLWAGTWTAWRESWGSGSDGAGSGLDADLLDGEEGAYYLNYNNFTNTPTIPTDTNDYVDSIAFNTASGVVTLGRTGSLADLTVDLDGRYLLTTGKAADSDKLDNLNSTDFVRYISTPSTSSTNSLANQAWIVNYTDANNVDYVYYNEATNTFNFNADTAYNANTATAVVSANTFKEGGTNLSGKYLGLTAKAADSNLLDGIDSSAFVRSNADDTIGGDINLTAALSYTQTNPVAGIHVIRPQGALYSTNTSAVTGYLKVTLPVSWTGTMMGMWIDIYDYAGDTNGESISLYVGGYNYATTTAWINCFAKVISSREDRYYNVRFGHDGTKCAIYIGEDTTVWSYPQVSVRDFFAGFGNATTANWQDGWDVGFTTTLGTITKTVVAGLTADYALNADKLDGQQGTYYLNTSTNFGGDVSGAYNAIVVANDSHTHDTRYYTETESDSRFLQLSGGTMTGRLVLDDLGLGVATKDNITTRTDSGFFQTSTATTAEGWPETTNNWYHLLSSTHSNTANYYALQLASPFYDSTKLYFRATNDNGSAAWNRVFTDAYHPNADKWTTARQLSLSGDASGSVSWDGSASAVLAVTVANDSHDHTRLLAVDDRDVKPNTTGIAGNVKAIKSFFTSLEGMTGTAGTNYQDLLVLDTYSDTSGGNVNAITLDKSAIEMRLWQAGQGATSWGTSQRVFADNYHPNADKWTTARTLTLTGDVTGSVSFDGSGAINMTNTAVANDSHSHDTQYSRKLFQTSNSSATANQYTKICRVTITSQYQDYSVTGYLHSAAEGGVDNAPERFDFSVKQQSTFGNNPLVYLRQYPTTTSRVDLGYVIVQNTPSTIVDLYAKVTSTYTVIHGHSVTESELSRSGWLSNQTINTTEPAGIVYRASNKFFHDDYHPNADKWTTARTITLTGDVTGSASIDGSANISIATTGGGGTDLTALTDMTQTFLTTDEFVVLDSNAPRRKAASEIIADLDIVTGNITGTLFADVIAANEIYADMIAANAITAQKIQANAINANKIAANAVTANEIKANEVKAAQLEISSTASVANSIFFDGPNNRIDIKDASGNLRVRIGQL